MRKHRQVLQFCIFILVCTGSLRAEPEEPSQPEKRVHLQFLPPPMEGTISMGIYDKDAKLVRVLYNEASVDEFTQTLNGLITEWDGMDNIGQPMPSGRYSARGVMVGNVEIEGEALHGNDWILNESSLRIQKIMDVELFDDQSLLLLVGVADKPAGLLRIKLDDSVIWYRTFPEDFVPKHLATNGKEIAVASENKIFFIENSTGTPDLLDQSSNNITALALSGDKIFVAEKGTLRVFALSDKSEKLSIPLTASVTAIRSKGEETVCVIEGQPHRISGQTFEKLTLSSVGQIRDIAFSYDGDLWLIDHQDGETSVKEFSMKGEFNRRLGMEPDSPEPVKILPSSTSDTIFLFEKNDEKQHLRSLSHTPSSTVPGESLWKIGFEKTILDSTVLDKVRGILKTHTGASFVPEEKISMTLVPNPMIKDKNSSMEIMVAKDDKGSILLRSDGLPLRRISENPKLRWVAAMREPGKRSITVYQSDGTVIEEYSVRRLGDMMTFDCGSFDYKNTDE